MIEFISEYHLWIICAMYVLGAVNAYAIWDEWTSVHAWMVLGWPFTALLVIYELSMQSLGKRQ